MKKLLLLVCILGLLAAGSTALAFDFSKYSWSRSYTSAEASTATASSTAIAWGCGDCVTTVTKTSVSATTWGGGTSFSSSSYGYAFSESDIICTEPPVCGDIDDDGICDDSDNCEFIYNPNQADSDDDQIGDVCDDTPGNPPTNCEPNDTACLLEEACPCENDWRNHGAFVTCTVKFRNDNRDLPGIEEIVSDAGCSDCGGSHSGQGCDDDNDGVTNTVDECPDTPRGETVDEVGCSI